MTSRVMFYFNILFIMKTYWQKVEENKQTIKTVILPANAQKSLKAKESVT